MNWAWRPARALALAVALTTALVVPFDDPEPTRGAFICEVLDAKATFVTPKFDDYSRGNYRVRKEDLLKGVTEEATKRKLGLRGLLVVGPVGPLWTYYVVVFLREANEIRINMLVFPHARITYKATGLVTTERYEKWLAELRETGVLRHEPPEAARNETDESKRDFAYTLLLSTWGAQGNGSRVDYGETRDQFEEIFNAILQDIKPTYDPYKE